MSSLFGGSRDDGGAARAAEIQAQQAREAREAEQKRLDMQKANEEAKRKELMDSEAKQAREREDQIKKMREDEQKRASALSATGGAPSTEELNRQRAAKAAAITGLPGFDSITSRLGGGKSLGAEDEENAQQAGAFGQQNSLVAKKAATGGKKFY